MGGFLWNLLSTLFLMGLFGIFFNGVAGYILYLGLGTFVYGLYIVYDTQLIMGGHSFKIELDDYILGAMVLYIDIIVLFLRILRLLAMMKKK